MHYCCVLITKDFPSDNVIEEVLAPFCEEDFFNIPEGECVRPAFLWDWYRLGGRYGGRIKLKVDFDDEKYQWRYITKEPRNGRLFRSALLDTLGHLRKSSWDQAYHEGNDIDHMGFHDGFVYVDAALADDIQNLSDMSCYCFVDQDGKAFARDYYNGDAWTDNPEFDAQFSKAKENSTGCYICVVDIHD